MKKASKFFSVSLLLILLVCSQASAGFYDLDYWYPTDLTTNATGSAEFILMFENASYESDFGLFSVDNVNNPTAVTNKLQVFSYSEEPLTGPRSVYFKFESGVWSAKVESGSYVTFDDQFGFYFGVHTGGINDPTADYLWFTDKKFNQIYSSGSWVSADINIEHIQTIFDGINKVTIGLDDQLGGGDRDFNDMVVSGIDLKPVPEPATMIISALTLIGAGGFVRRKFFKQV